MSAISRSVPTVVVASAALFAAGRCLAQSRRNVHNRRILPSTAGERLLLADTPCLCIDLSALDENKRRLEALIAKHQNHHNIMARPIVKAHKTVNIAKYQLQSNVTRGVCCAKVCEAEAMLDAGITDILISNEIIGARKLDRLTKAMKSAGVQTVRIVADSVIGAAQLAEAAARSGCTFDVLIEISCGQLRCGVASPEQAVAVAREVRASANLRLIGVQSYQGAAQHFRSKTEMQNEIDKVTAITKDVLAPLQAESLFDVPANEIVVTGGGSGTFEYEMQSGLFTEVQPGSYLFNDVDYSKNLSADGSAEGEKKWKASLFLLTTVMSSTTRGDGSSYIIIDAGIKAHSIDSGMPRLYGHTDLVCVNGGDEHFKVEFPAGQTPPTIGDKVLLQPGHVDPTFNMHDDVVVFRSGGQHFTTEEMLATDPIVEV